MKKLRTSFVIFLVLIGILSATAFAANDFTFALVTSGSDYSTLAPKQNDKTFATVNVTSANNYRYQYSVATGIRTGYVTGWTNHTGTGEFDINYYNKPSRNTNLRLHGATSEASGTSTIRGTWIP